ncbi:protein-glutamate methylesterase/protein-glutamine glutaminase [Thalassotalea hakodatensis]|uniref:protein-glutamate methylesterase/protein-glutamine glutaminase n=1 Tax=Thalassotalea hakodatensis TaxID=3030492 RepID=UPI002572EF62|nr:chemotaxis response regulator protein-glutamate methylesterase [Thalassotalea hakodatensis]
MSIEVMIVDDSAVVRQVISSVLNQVSDINVYAVANDPIFAYDKMKKQWPDVVILDIEMPRMDGITFLKKIMAEKPTPVIICSSLAEHGAELSLSALAAGAFEIITKPTIGVKNFLESSGKEIITVVRAASVARIRRVKRQVSALPEDIAQKQDDFSHEPMNMPLDTDLASLAKTTDRVVGIGSSTGGTIALEKVLTQLPRTCPGIVIVQHMPEKFTAAFAERLNSICAVEIKEASSGDRIIPGHVLIAPGGKHIQVKRSGGQYITIVSEGPAVNRHCPSVDVLFNSLATHVKQNATGIILTGMGNDGAKGLLAMKVSGSKTVAQNEKSSVVFGMPKEAIKLNAAKEIVDLDDMVKFIN